MLTLCAQDRNHYSSFIHRYGNPTKIILFYGHYWLTWDHKSGKQIVDKDKKNVTYPLPQFTASIECPIDFLNLSFEQLESFSLEIPITKTKTRITFHNIKNNEKWYLCFLPFFSNLFLKTAIQLPSSPELLSPGRAFNPQIILTSHKNKTYQGSIYKDDKTMNFLTTNEMLKHLFSTTNYFCPISNENHTAGYILFDSNFLNSNIDISESQ